MNDRVGQQFGSYRLIRLLGRGGFAEVFLGEHTRLGSPAAIKILSTRLTPEEVARFQQEARIIAQLDHPNIVRVFDFDVVNQIPFLVMNYAPNGTLRQRHAKGAPVPLPTIVSYVKQVADSLQYAHDRRLIHRDVKPENMLVGTRDEVLLSDFGIAVVSQSSRYSTKDMAGTVAYMAPEQIQSHPRPASDQYSLGVVVYEWLCGERPFHGSYSEIAVKHTVVPPPPLREKLPTISPHLEQVILTALEKDPKDRFATVRAFATALGQASQPTRIIAPPIITPAPPFSPTTGPTGGWAPTGQPPLSAQGTFSSEQPVQVSGFVPSPRQIAQINFSPASGVPQAPKRIPRRTLVAGLGLVGLAAVGGGIIWLRSAQPTRPALPTPLGTTLYTYNQLFPVTAVSWSPDSKNIVSSSMSNIVLVWQASNGKALFSYREPNGDFVTSVDWSPDGKRIVSSTQNGVVDVWQASDGSHLLTHSGNNGSVSSVAFSPDSSLIASSGPGSVEVWEVISDVAFGSFGGGIPPHWSAISWSPDGKSLAAVGDHGNVYMWQLSNGDTNPLVYGQAGVTTVAWSPNGTQVVSGSKDSTVKIWQASDGTTLVTYAGHTDQINSVAWSRDGREVASCSNDKTVHVWQASDATRLFTYKGHKDAVVVVAWSPDGKRIASGSNDKTVQIWQAG